MKGGNRRYEDHRAAARCCHMWKRIAAKPEIIAQIDIQRALEGSVRYIRGRTEMRVHRGIANENVETPPSRDDGLDQRLQRSLIGDIADPNHGLPALRSDRRRDALASLNLTA